MKGKAFYKKVEQDPRIIWMGAQRGATQAEDEVVVCCKSNGAYYRLPIDAVLAESWKSIEGVIMGKQPPSAIEGVRRLIGDFRFTRAWNKDLLLALFDRPTPKKKR